MTWVLNPRLNVQTRVLDDGFEWHIEAAVRGKGLRCSVVPGAKFPNLHALVVQLAETEDAPLPVDDATAAELADFGVLVRRAEAPREVAFSATLHDPLNETVVPPRTLVVNRRVRIDDAPAGRPHARGRAAWVVDPVRGIELPYWIDAAEERAIERALTRGGIPSSRVMRQSLVNAGILHDPEATAVARRRLARRMASSRTRLVSHGYMAFVDLLPALFVAALRRYFRAIVEEGYLPFGDGEPEARYFMHNEPLGTWLHRRIEPLVARAVSRPIKRSYSYTISYTEGAVLRLHTDRPQCEYTLSLAIDATPDAGREQAWPLCLDSKADRGVVAFRLAPGDGLLFRGRELPHFRDELGTGRTAASVLFHFVDENFQGTLD